MPFYDKFMEKNSFVDCVTPTNFVLYVLLREYIGLMKIDNSVSHDIETDTEDKVSVYMFFYKTLRDFSSKPFECIINPSTPLSSRLQALTRGRIERLRNTFEILIYTHPNTLKDEIFSDYLCMEDEQKFVVVKDSVFGLFLRKFALGFHHQSFEEMSRFMDLFFNAYDSALQNERPKAETSEDLNRDFISTVSTRSHAMEASTKISNSVGQLGGRPQSEVKKSDEILTMSKSLFPNLSAPYYAAHLLATRKHNLTEAESNLHAYIETRMAAVGLDKNMSNNCAYLSVAAASMHLSFGQWQRSKCLEKEALKKALESECKGPLNHVRVTHTLLSSNMEPFRYDGELPSMKMTQSSHVALAELRASFWDMVDWGSPPKNLLIMYFNSTVAMSPTYFAVCLLDVATLWSLYGYPTLYVALLQCIVNADCLQPCPNSDVVLTTTFSGLIREYNAAGAVHEALKLAKVCSRVLCRFSEGSCIRQASLQVELEQSLRSQTDLLRCDRLINALRLCCPWEATLYQAEVERCRGNKLTSHDLLQHIVDSVAERLGPFADPCGQSGTDIQPAPLTNQFTSQDDPFIRVQFPDFDRQVPVGGQVKLAQIGLRARLALVELLLPMGLGEQVEKHLNHAMDLAKRYRLELGVVTIKLLQQVVSVQLGQTLTGWVDLYSAAHELFHRADRWARYRCTVFVARVNLQFRENLNSTDSALSAYTEQLLEAFQFYRSIDDRKRILDAIVLLASSLHALGRVNERNKLSQIYLKLRHECQFGGNLENEIQSLCCI